MGFSPASVNICGHGKNKSKKCTKHGCVDMMPNSVVFKLYFKFADEVKIIRLVCLYSL